VGAYPIQTTAEQHDCILATTSHLPFLIASSLVRSTPHASAPFVGPGFRSTSRLAGAPSYMMMGILKSNRDHILGALRSFRHSLVEIESALRNEDYPELKNLLHRACSDYHALVDRETILQSPIL
jgi:prephenate dehydrogenase